MSRVPRFKIFDADGTYQAACKEPEAGACLMALYGDGATIRFDHGKYAIVWTEGSESQPAAESWDHVAETIYQRMNAYRVKAGLDR